MYNSVKLSVHFHWRLASSMTRKGAVHATARLANDAELRLAHLGQNLEAVPLA